ncbi:hypothetical protein HXX76_015377 [Chlamydomonas incerta]|uniref:Uncharacterized protein n=1 Tax=Chlamydomonas incerta TaxID=51695 RepID=A0A835S9X9_CHLIN|nr:hypothetical protein HXX76_015377 [Chlamydomonas incerta]|eukprot:KAG2423412.1 hypothetical protein HXX76_015377 [Chlamydomonas incerta]
MREVGRVLRGSGLPLLPIGDPSAIERTNQALLRAQHALGAPPDPAAAAPAAAAVVEPAGGVAAAGSARLQLRYNAAFLLDREGTDEADDSLYEPHRRVSASEGGGSSAGEEDTADTLGPSSEASVRSSVVLRQVGLVDQQVAALNATQRDLLILLEQQRQATAAAAAAPAAAAAAPAPAAEQRPVPQAPPLGRAASKQDAPRQTLGAGPPPPPRPSRSLASHGSASIQAARLQGAAEERARLLALAAAAAASPRPPPEPPAAAFPAAAGQARQPPAAAFLAAATYQPPAYQPPAVAAAVSLAPATTHDQLQREGLVLLPSAAQTAPPPERAADLPAPPPRAPASKLGRAAPTLTPPPAAPPHVLDPAATAALVAAASAAAARAATAATGGRHKPTGTFDAKWDGTGPADAFMLAANAWLSDSAGNDDPNHDDARDGLVLLHSLSQKAVIAGSLLAAWLQEEHADIMARHQAAWQQARLGAGLPTDGYCGKGFGDVPHIVPYWRDAVVHGMGMSPAAALAAASSFKLRDAANTSESWQQGVQRFQRLLDRCPRAERQDATFGG